MVIVARGPRPLTMSVSKNRTKKSNSTMNKSQIMRELPNHHPTNPSRLTTTYLANQDEESSV